MIYLNKILPVLVSPLLIGLALMLFGAWKRRTTPVALGLLFLYVLSTPYFVNRGLYRLTEGFETRQDAETVKRVQHTVVLGGMTNPVQTDTGLRLEWSRYERFNGAMELFEANKTRRLIFTNGIMPWGPAVQPEGEFLVDRAKEQGIPDSALLLVGPVENTRDEAKAVAAVLPKGDTIRLVTSAFHMRRSRLLFERQGFVVLPYSVDFGLEEEGQLTAMSFLPTAKSLAMAEIALREWLGYWVYWFTA
jgi:uncharacterized SAM-binding protein YcdF (DUF218 family)